MVLIITDFNVVFNRLSNYLNQEQIKKKFNHTRPDEEFDKR